MRYSLSLGFVAVAAVGAMALAPAAAQAQDVGVNAAIRNSVQTRSGAAAFAPARLRATVRVGDQFVTGPNSQVQVLLRDRSTFTVGPNARMTVDRFVVSEGGATASVAQGAFRFASGRTTRGPSRTAVNTPVASIGVRGTIVDGLVGPEVSEVLRGQPGVPAFGGDPETLLLVVLRGPVGDADTFDTPGEVEVEGQGSTVRLDKPGQAYLGTSEGVYGPFFLPEAASVAMTGLLSPPPETRVASDGDPAEVAATVQADDVSYTSEGGPPAEPLDQYEPLPPPDQYDPGTFPFFPPTQPFAI
ncbi:MAG: FecR domain-containing protein [Brevundimonas sp.]